MTEITNQINEKSNRYAANLFNFDTPRGFLRFKKIIYLQPFFTLFFQINQKINRGIVKVWRNMISFTKICCYHQMIL